MLAGLSLLILGGELLVRGASALARAARVSPLVIGLTVVAFGTSAPEFAVTLQSAFTDSADLAVGGIVGSNIANTLLILGACALVAPMVVSSQVVRYHLPAMIVASALLWGVALDGRIDRGDGAILFAGLVAYNIWSIRRSRAGNDRTEGGEAVGAAPRTLLRVSMLVVGLVCLALGARWLVGGAVAVSTALGVPELVVGLTVVALGTSLPELATSLTANVRGQGDMAVGNVVGSNLFNILGVLGLAALVAPRGIAVSSEALWLDLPFMMATAAAALPIFLTGFRVSRAEGAVFLLYYLAYVAYLAMEARPGGVRTPEVILAGFVLPLSASAVIVSGLHWRRVRSAGRTGRTQD